VYILSNILAALPLEKFRTASILTASKMYASSSDIVRRHLHVPWRKKNYFTEQNGVSLHAAKVIQQHSRLIKLLSALTSSWQILPTQLSLNWLMQISGINPVALSYTSILFSVSAQQQSKSHSHLLSVTSLLALIVRQCATYFGS
jgi:hypothetical protein